MVNEIHLIGNLGKDPEAKHLDGGNMVANLAVATSKKYKKCLKHTGEVLDLPGKRSIRRCMRWRK